MAEKEDAAAGADGAGGKEGGEGDGGAGGKTLATSSGDSGDGSGDGDGTGDGKDGQGKGKTLATGGGEGDGSGSKDGDGDGQKQGAPESYTDFTLAEGVTPLGDAEKTELHSMLKDLDLSQENAQKLVDFQAKIAKGQSEAQLAEFAETTKGWRDATIKELGADYKKELGFASKAIERFGSSELRQLLDDTKVGEHPEIAKFLIKVGKTVSEDKLGDSGSGGKGEKSPGDTFYPGMNEEIRKSRQT